MSDSTWKISCHAFMSTFHCVLAPDRSSMLLEMSVLLLIINSKTTVRPLYKMWAMQCIPHSSCGQCSAYPIAPAGNAVHTILLLWAMQCIPHSSCGQCSAYPTAPMGNAVHTP